MTPRENAMAWARALLHPDLVDRAFVDRNIEKRVVVRVVVPHTMFYQHVQYADRCNDLTKGRWLERTVAEEDKKVLIMNSVFPASSYISGQPKFPERYY